MKMPVMKTLKYQMFNLESIAEIPFTISYLPKKENQNIYNLEAAKYRDYLNIQNVAAVVASESQYHVLMRFYIETKEYLKVDRIQEADDRCMIQLIHQMELKYDQ